MIGLKVSTEEADAIKSAAMASGVSQSAYIRNALIQAMESDVVAQRMSELAESQDAICAAISAAEKMQSRFGTELLTRITATFAIVAGAATSIQDAEALGQKGAAEFCGKLKKENLLP